MRLLRIPEPSLDTADPFGSPVTLTGRYNRGPCLFPATRSSCGRCSKPSAMAEQNVPGGVSTAADRLHLTDENRQELIPSGTQRLLDNRIGWAKTYLLEGGRPGVATPSVHPHHLTLAGSGLLSKSLHRTRY